MSRNRYNYCIVPNCRNTSFRTPNKLFFNVPKDPELRKMWCSVMNRDQMSCQTTRQCCEDHFDLQEDMDNYIKYKLVGGNLKLKKGVVPHKFDCMTGLEKEDIRDLNNDEEEYDDITIHPIEMVECEIGESMEIPVESDISKTNRRQRKEQVVQADWSNQS